MDGAPRSVVTTMPRLVGNIFIALPHLRPRSGLQIGRHDDDARELNRTVPKDYSPCGSRTHLRGSMIWIKGLTQAFC